MTKFLTTLVALVAITMTTVNAAPINVVPPATIGTTSIIDFNALPSGNIAGTLGQPGATFGERFAGQTVATGSGFDVVSGSPTATLTVVANTTLADNIAILTNSGSQLIYGDLGGAVGEGALAFVFAFDQSQLGFDVVGGDSGSVFASFYRRNGSLIQTLILGPVTTNTFAFQRDLGITDIAGVLLTNDDLSGVAYDNLRFNNFGVTNPIPEPATLAVFGGIVLAGALGYRRRKAAATA